MKHTNELIHSTSPYLLQHAHNPVNWLPWGEKAFQLSKQDDRPLLVSIGYAACHWCHVMEHESFEDEATAKLMNDYFVCVKIDREERPDIDHIYMDAIQAMTGSGGWPLNIFLTPELKPFYGGTYFPPIRAYNRPSWKEILVMIHTAWQERKHEITEQAEGLLEHLSKQAGWESAGGNDLFNKDTPRLIAEGLLKQADATNGGFGGAPKFPQFASISYLLEHDDYFNNPEAKAHALLSIDKMLEGGINDQLGGGLARYATDDRWLVPHFEKMMYDNALLVPVLCDALLITKEKKYETAIHRTLEFIQREMMNKDGAFFTAIDADSEGVEGKYYTWELKEIHDELGDEATLFCAYFNITEKGNFSDPHHPHLPPVNIPNITKSLDEVAASFGITADKAEAIIQRGIKKLYKKRQQRIRPITDDKILLSLNALANRAFTRAYGATGLAAYLDVAERNMQFLLKHCSVNKTGAPFAEGALHQYRQNIPAFLDDYAFLIQALMELQEATGNTDLLNIAKTLLEQTLAHFADTGSSLFFFTNDAQTDVILRKKETYDGSQPSSNAIMCENLAKMAIYFNRPEWAQRAEQMLLAIGGAAAKYPSSFAAWASVLQKNVFGYSELSLTGSGAKTNLPEVLKIFIPGRLMMAAEANNADWPMLKDKFADNELNIYVCQKNTCLAPVKIPEQIPGKLAIFKPH